MNHNLIPLGEAARQAMVELRGTIVARHAEARPILGSSPDQPELLDWYGDYIRVGKLAFYGRQLWSAQIELIPQYVLRRCRVKGGGEYLDYPAERTSFVDVKLREDELRRYLAQNFQV